MKKHFSLDNFPEDWNIFSVEDLLKKFQNGYAFSSSGYLNESRDIVPIITMANISIEGSFNFDYKTAKKWNAKDTDKLKRYLVEDGDLIIAMTDVTPSMELIGRGAFVSTSQPLLLNQRVGLLKTIDDVDNKFLSYFFNSDYWRKYSKVSASLGAQANISTKDILKGQIPLPPLPEQKKIAEILSLLDQSIDFYQKKICKLSYLKKATINHLMINGIDHNNFKESEFGRIPENWRVTNLGDFANITKLAGFEYTEHFDYSVGGEIIALRALNLVDGKINLENIQTIPRSVSNSLPRSKLFYGDILISYVGTVGQLGLVEENDRFHLAPNVAKISCDLEKVNPKFIFYQLLTDISQENIKNLTTITSQPSLNMSNIRKIKILVSPIEEQNRIVNILELLDRNLINVHQKFAALKLLKKSLSQDLLEGRKRVNV